MGFGMFTAQQSPIAIDFGSTSVKLMQLDKQDPPNLIAAAELGIPESIRQSPDQVASYLEAELPGIIKSAGFKGKKAVTVIPSHRTIIQHMQVAAADGVKLDDIVAGQIQMQMNCSPNSLVCRCIEVGGAQCREQGRKEAICFAAPREAVMRYVSILKKCKLNVTSMHTESMATIWAFQHINRREDDAFSATLYLNMGNHGTTVTISHGTKVVFSRYIQVGGYHFDQVIARKRGCELHEATVLRHALQEPLGTNISQITAPDPGEEHHSDESYSPADEEDQSYGVAAKSMGEAAATATERRTGDAAASILDLNPQPNAADVVSEYDFSELLDTISDEISMCLRYHSGLFSNQGITRTIFVGGESRQPWLTHHIAEHLGMSTYLANPLNRFPRSESIFTPGLTFEDARPDWAVVCGLINAPTDQ